MQAFIPFYLCLPQWGEVERRNVAVTDEVTCRKKKRKVLCVLRLDGVCAAAASELAFGGCAPPISRCETGKLFNPLIHLQSSFAVLSEEINILLIAPH